MTGQEEDCDTDDEGHMVASGAQIYADNWDGGAADFHYNEAQAGEESDLEHYDGEDIAEGHGEFELISVSRCQIGVALTVTVRFVRPK